MADDPKMDRTEKIHLSYTFFEVGGKVPMAPEAAAAVDPKALRS